MKTILKLSACAALIATTAVASEQDAARETVKNHTHVLTYALVPERGGASPATANVTYSSLKRCEDAATNLKKAVAESLRVTPEYQGRIASVITSCDLK